MANQGGQAPAGWYNDPGSSGQLRWWDGQQWTGHFAPSATSHQNGPKVGGLDSQQVHTLTPDAWSTHLSSDNANSVGAVGEIPGGHSDTTLAMWAYRGSLIAAGSGLIICLLEGWYLTITGSSFFGFAVASFIWLAPTIVLNKTKPLQTLARSHAYCALNLALWISILVAVQAVITQVALSRFPDWDLSPNPGFLIEIATWIFTLTTYSRGISAASSGTTYRAPLTPWLIGAHRSPSGLTQQHNSANWN
jgi:Protein of unknown function (DUF2510)